MLLTIFVFLTGCVIGQLRGGSLAGLISARFHRPGLLVLGITTMLVLNLIGPAFPMLWAIVGTGSLLWFGLRNLHITGMIVMLIGLLLNLVPLLANGTMPVSDRALTSVGDVTETGAANIDGLRESTDTATNFSAFGDVIPVPIFNAVVSIGDVIMLVALADIAANLYLRARRRDELDDAGVTFAETAPSEDIARPAILSPLAIGSRPAHAAHRRPRRKAAPSNHVPAHAIESSKGLFAPDAVIVLDGPNAYVEQPPQEPARATDGQIDDAPAVGEGTAFEQAVTSTIEETPVMPKTEIILPAEPDIVLTNNTDSASAPKTSEVGVSPGRVDNDAVDRRPIIDLTVSPTDAQLKEFLRRRAEADIEHARRTTPGPRRRRGRTPRANAKVAEVSR